MKVAARSMLVGSLALLAACSSGLEAPPPTLTPQASSSSLSIPIVSAADDAEEKQGGGMELTGGLLDFRAKDGVLQTVGVRFQNVAIPQGATIESAYFTVKGGAADSGSVTLKLQGEAADNALTFSSSKNNLSSRSKTAAAVSWQPNSWAAGKPYQSGNIASIVQEVVSRSGWKSGNALALFVSGSAGSSERSAIAFGGSAANVPALVVTFSGGNTTPTPTEPAPPPPSEPTAPAGSTLVSVKVAAVSDDIEELSSGTMSVGKALDFAQSGQKVGLRFAGLTIPKGATITSASIALSSLVADSGSVKLSFKAQADDNAASFATTAKNLSTRPLTTASAVWQPSAWSLGQVYRTSDLSAVVQEVVSRSGWTSGNAIAFIVTGDTTNKRSASAYDKDTLNVPVLSVAYTVPTTPTPEPEPEPETPTPEPEPETPTPEPEPETPTPEQPGTPSAEQALWLGRLKKTIANPRYDQYNGWMNPLTQGASGNIFIYGRMMNFYVTSLILAYRETGDRALMVQLEAVMNIAKGTLADTNGDGYRNWLEKHQDAESPELYMTDNAVMDEILTHSMVASAAYALKQAGFSSSATFWTDYLKNDFEAKWRKRKNKASGFPFLSHFLMHPTSQFVRYHYYMYKLTGDAAYLDEAKRLAGVVNGTIRADGTWAHIAGQTSGCQPTVYTIITGQAFADLATNGSGLVSDSTMKRMAGAMARNVIRNTDGTSLGGSICGNSSYGGGNVYYFVSYPYSQLARWDDSGKLRLTTERAYAATEKGRTESPRIYNLPAMMVFALGE